MTSSTKTPEEARRHLTIEHLKFKTGAMDPNHAMLHDQAIVGITLSRCSPLMTQSERFDALHIYHDIIKSETALIVCNLLIDELEHHADPTATILESAKIYVELDAKLDARRKRLHELLYSKFDALILSENSCISAGEV